MLERASANELARWQARFPVPPATDEFSSRWSPQDWRREQAERARRHGLVVEEDEAGPSRPPRMTGNGGEGCSSSRLPPAKDEPPNDEDELMDYAAAMYRQLEIGAAAVAAIK
jgi:hypothetical protein